jgi:hypothetical protein
VKMHHVFFFFFEENSLKRHLLFGSGPRMANSRIWRDDSFVSIKHITDVSRSSTTKRCSVFQVRLLAEGYLNLAQREDY